MRHPEGGYILQTLAGIERVTDCYGRESLVLHFNDEDEEPVCVMLTNPSQPKDRKYPYDQGLLWLLAAIEEDGDGKWGKVPSALEADEMTEADFAKASPGPLPAALQNHAESTNAQDSVLAVAKQVEGEP